MKYFTQAWLLLILLGLFGCKPEKTDTTEPTSKQLFTLIDASDSGLDFNISPGEQKYFLGSAGAAAVDFNNDSLPDIFFISKAGNKLYQNLGNFKFKDITESANLIDFQGNRGLAVADVNGDGWMDIYILKRGVEWDSIKQDYTDYGRNLLYINNGDMTFTEEGEKYKLNVPGLSRSANFFDYDNDGDLDMYLINWTGREDKVFDFNYYNTRPDDKYHTDRFYENIEGKYFIDVSSEVGLLYENSYGHSISVSDINNDGWQDMYVGNDYFGRDYLYINNGDKTFTESASSYFNKQPLAAMGSDFADVNNDGYTDLFTAEMLPEDHKRQKLNVLPYSYEVYSKFSQMGAPQYQRNMLQVNNQGQGFSEIGFLAGVSATEWSWNTLFGDYNLDGYKDLFVTNGFKRDLTNVDLIKENYDSNAFDDVSKIHPMHKDKDISNAPSVKVGNYIFQNKGGLQFDKMNEKWGVDHPAHSLGAAQADLDNDGDLDLVIHNLDTVAQLYRNNARELLADKHWLAVKLKGENLNTFGVGSKVYLFSNGSVQFQEIHTSRGFRSSSEPIAHFGLGESTQVDSITIVWPGGKEQRLYDVTADQIIIVDQKDATPNSNSSPIAKMPILFEEITEDMPSIDHKELPFIDFKRDRLLHHQLSREGPGIAVGDVNNDGNEDFYVGGASGQSGSLIVQGDDGSFKKVNNPIQGLPIELEEMGCLLLDTDDDGDLDLYTASGSNEFGKDDIAQMDRHLTNLNNGKFGWNKASYYGINTSTGTTAACDFDKDGDLDLFVGGRLVPGEYPTHPRSYLLINDKGLFQDMTGNLAPGLDSIGMVTSALWTDYDNDGWIDLIIVGEWMPITVFKNEKGKLVKTEVAGLEKSNGWWNSIIGGDFDQDGDIDYLAGNLGLNAYCKASAEQPVSLYAADFDNNGTLDPVLFHYVSGVNIPFVNRDIFCEQMPAFNNKFYTFSEFANATVDNIFEQEKVENAQKLYAYTLASAYIENKGTEGFKISSLPTRVQFGPVYGMQTQDINNDGHLDVLIVGNSFSNHFEYGSYDALDGVVLLGDGNGGFNAIDGSAIGFHVPGDAKAISSVYQTKTGQEIFIVTNSNGKVQFFKKADHKPLKNWEWNHGDLSAMIIYKDGSKRRVERHIGSGYLSQSSNYELFNPELITSIEIETINGTRRQIWPLLN